MFPVHNFELNRNIAENRSQKEPDLPPLPLMSRLALHCGQRI